jgi:hypothetical protein
MRKAWLVGGLSLVVLGCGDSAGTSTGAGGGTTSGSGGSTVAGTGGSTTTGGCPEGGAPQGTGGGVAACADIGASDCFSNYDCAATERCENVGTSDLPTACCVTGERGAGALGDGCVAENDCSSSLCIEGGTCGFTCSDKCTSDDDCPADLPSCIVIAFSGTSDKFCTP